MPITQILRQECKICHKIALEESRFTIGRTTAVRLACGHSIYSESLESDDSVYDKIIFSDGCKPRPYQIEAYKFAEKANIRCIIADEQGLGKTIEACGLLRLHPTKLLPAIIACPSSAKLQWMYEIHRIAANSDGAMDKQFLTQVINSGKDLALPGFQVYVITYEMLKKDDLFKLLPEGYIKCLILDECQKIKNHLSERAKAVQKMAKNVEHILPMSGTPIKNNAGEYFTVLNLVAPTRFPHYRQYIDRYCNYYNNGWGDKIGGLKDPERFHEDTKDIIIRRTKAEVLKDLPPKDRKFHHVELNRNLHKEYDAMMKKLEEKLYGDDGEESGFAKTTAIIAIMSELRHITGKSKVIECVDYVTEYLMSTDRKLVVFTHHKDVMEMLEFKINEWCEDGGFSKVLTLHSGLDGLKRAELIKQFKEDNNRRILLASTLAAGEAINLQFCSDAVMLERQWNPANEEQAEDRFHRFGQLNSVTITYMIATGTIDDFFTQLVEQKRAIVAATLDNKTIEWEQQSLMSELAETLVMKGMKAWKL